MTMKTWTHEAISELFSVANETAIEVHREATRSHFNPFGDSCDTLIWFGSLAEARDRKDWPNPGLDDELEDLDPSEITTEQWEEAAIRAVDCVVGTGRPIAVAFCDGAFPVLFCETASDAEVSDAVASFYDSSEVS